MILYTDKTLDRAIKETEKSIMKLSSLKPTEDLSSQDISNAVFFIKRFQEECISEKQRRDMERGMK